MAVTYVSGTYGTVDNIGNVFNWNLAQSKPTEQIRNSATKGGTGRIPGIDSYSGSYQRAGGKPLHLPGVGFTFKGFAGSNTGAPGGPGPSYSLPAIVESIAIVWDWAQRKLIRHTVNFKSTGVMTYTPTDTAVVDASAIVQDRIAILPANDFVYGAVPTKIEGKKTATLTLTSMLQEIANSDTGGAKSAIKGPLDWKLSIETENAVRVLTNGTYVDTLKLFINATEFWALGIGIVEEDTNVKVDIESGAILGQTINIAMSAFDSLGNISAISAPGGGSPFWP